MPVDGFEWKKNMPKFNEKFLKKDGDEGYIFQADVEYPKRLDNFCNDLPFLSERMKIKRFSKSVCNLYDKNEYLAHIRTLKQAVNHGLILK